MTTVPSQSLRHAVFVGACIAFMHSAPAFAQGNASNPTNAGKIDTIEQKATTGTAPKDMGSTGWTGPHRGEQTGTTDSAAGQPLMATGVDLKGPPRRFSPSETPE
jgi:hypothetical protein